MKRPVVLSLVLVPLVLASVAGGYWIFGTLTEQGVKRYFEGENPLEGAELALDTYERGFFRSRATSSVSLLPGEEPVRLVNEIYHGPLALAPGGAKAGAGYVVTTLDLDSLPAEARERVAAIYGEKEPLVVTTSVGFGGARTSRIELAAIDHDADGTQVRFSGGSGEFTFSPDNSRIEGEFALEPLSFRMEGTEEGEEGGYMRIRSERTFLSVKVTPSDLSVEVDGGKFGLAFDGEERGSLDIGGMQFRSSFSPTAPGSKVMLGSGKFTLPEASLAWKGAAGAADAAADAAGSVSMKDFTLEVSTSETGGMVTTSADYRVGSLAMDGAAAAGAGEEAAPMLDLLGKGVQLTAGATLPRVVVEEFAAFQETLGGRGGLVGNPEGAELSAEQAEELARLLESALRNVSAGTGFQIGMRIGEEASGPSASLRFGYRGERPLTAQKTYIELVEASELRLETKVPKALLEANESMQEQIAGMVAMGALKEDGPNFSSVLVLDGTKLSANGQALPILENFLPLLSQEIPWDGIFTGMEAAAKARAESGAADGAGAAAAGYEAGQ